MSSFTHHRNNQHRYNIYESHDERIETISYYKPVRNTLLFIAITLSLLVLSFISFDKYVNQKTNLTQMLLIKQMQQNQVKDEITHLALTNAISGSIIKKIKTEDSFENINDIQLKRIVENVMEKIEHSPNKIIYPHK